MLVLCPAPFHACADSEKGSGQNMYRARVTHAAYTARQSPMDA